MEYEASLCSRCKLPRSETTKRENDGAYRARPVRCFACQELDHAAADWAKDENSDTAGLMFAIVEDD